jgi:hypothetical protein
LQCCAGAVVPESKPSNKEWAGKLAEQLSAVEIRAESALPNRRAGESVRRGRVESTGEVVQVEVEHKVYIAKL